MSAPPADLTADYAKLRPRYDAFTIGLERLLQVLLQNSMIDYFAIEPRTKDLESFEEKIVREDKAGKYKIIDDVTDLTGIRIIAFLHEDCERICSLISDNFNVDKLNSSKKGDELDPDKFGYLSTHYVVSLSDRRSELPEFAIFKGMKAEIQVRTLLQHTWAAIDWKFRYKNESELPRDLRRSLFRISALLEAADNEFSSVNREINSLRDGYKRHINEGSLDIGLNIESIKTYIANSPLAAQALDAARAGGFDVPDVEESASATFHLFSGTMSILGIETLAQLDNALKKEVSHAVSLFRNISPMVTEQVKNRRLQAPAVIRYLLYSSANRRQRISIRKNFALSAAYADIVDQVRPALA